MCARTGHDEHACARRLPAAFPQEKTVGAGCREMAKPIGGHACYGDGRNSLTAQQTHPMGGGPLLKKAAARCPSQRTPGPHRSLRVKNRESPFAKGGPPRLRQTPRGGVDYCSRADRQTARLCFLCAVGQRAAVISHQREETKRRTVPRLLTHHYQWRSGT